jgi:hypothetical protein
MLSYHFKAPGELETIPLCEAIESHFLATYNPPICVFLRLVVETIHLPDLEMRSRVTNIVRDRSAKVMGGIQVTWASSFQAAVLDYSVL